MGFRDRLFQWLGGDEILDPDAIVEAALVELWESGLVTTALEEAGIECSASEELSARYSLERVLPMARILVPAGRVREAQAVIASVQQRSR